MGHICTYILTYKNSIPRTGERKESMEPKETHTQPKKKKKRKKHQRKEKKKKSINDSLIYDFVEEIVMG
jgi:hypothetical protein